MFAARLVCAAPSCCVTARPRDQTTRGLGSIEAALLVQPERNRQTWREGARSQNDPIFSQNEKSYVPEQYRCLLRSEKVNHIVG